MKLTAPRFYGTETALITVKLINIDVQYHYRLSLIRNLELQNFIGSQGNKEIYFVNIKRQINIKNFNNFAKSIFDTGFVNIFKKLFLNLNAFRFPDFLQPGSLLSRIFFARIFALTVSIINAAPLAFLTFDHSTRISTRD